MSPGAPWGLAVRLSVTGACQLRCTYCLPAGEIGPRPAEAPLGRDDVALLLGFLHRTVGVRKLRITGGEPLVRGDLTEIVGDAAALGIPDIALTTNGQLLARRAAELARAGLKRVNVSLDSLDRDTFRAVAGGGSLERTLAGIAAAREAGLSPVKLNMVVLRGVNDHQAEALLRFGLERDCPVRFLELMPVGVARADFARRFIGSDEVRRRLSRIGSWWPLRPEPGASSVDWRVRDGAGRETTCGFISPCSRPFCAGCDRLRVSSEGLLLGCLVAKEGFPLGGALDAARRGELDELEALVRRARASKRAGEFEWSPRCMGRVGG